MAFVVPNIGENTLLGYCKTNLSTCTLRLFVNNIMPNPTDVLISYTPAVSVTTFPVLNNFGAIATDGSGKAAMSITTTITLTQNAAITQTVYGAYVDDGTNLILAEQFVPAITLLNAGDLVKITAFTFRLYN